MIHGAAARPDALLDFRFGTEPTDGLWVPLRPLLGDREAWFDRDPVTVVRQPDREIRTTTDLMVVAIWSQISPRTLAQESRGLYREAISACHQAGFRHLLRVWNHLPDINGRGPGEDEVYRRFCAGRGAALAALGLDPADQPAASAMGGPAGTPLLLVFLASRVPGRPLENPRQVAAHRYPADYAAVRPAFARATLWRDRLLISGTAAIIGHESQHAGDVDRQLRCTLDNLCVLLDHACAEADARRVLELQARVYLRDPAHLAQVRARIETELPGTSSIIYLQADVCRRELLVEIEATARLCSRPKNFVAPIEWSN